MSNTQVLNFLQTLLKSLLTYLDQVYVVQERNVMNVRLVISVIWNKIPPYLYSSDLAYFLVSEHIFGSARIVENIRTGVKAWLEWERTTGSVKLHRAQKNSLTNLLEKPTPIAASSQFWSTTFFDITNTPRLKIITSKSPKHSTSRSLPKRRRFSKTTPMHSSTVLADVFKKKQPGRKKSYLFQRGAQ